MVLENVKEYEQKGKGGAVISKRSSVLLNGAHIAMVRGVTQIVPCTEPEYK